MGRIEPLHCLGTTEWVNLDFLSPVNMDDLAGVLLVELLEVVGSRSNRQAEVLLALIDAIESLECRLGPDDKSAWMTAWGQLQKVQFCDISNSNAREVTECESDRRLVGSMDHQGAELLDITSVTVATLTGTTTRGLVRGLNILLGTNFSQDTGSFLCLLSRNVQNQRQRLNLGDTVTMSLN